MKQPIATLSTILALLLNAPLSQAEVLEHISDETEPGVSAPESSPNDDRRIIYRVICTPGGEVLPDCERAFNDTETSAKPEPTEKPESEFDSAEPEHEILDEPKPAKAVGQKAKKTPKKPKKTTQKGQKKPSPKAKPKKASKNKQASP